MKKIALIIPLLLALFILAYFVFNLHFFANSGESIHDNTTPVISDEESIIIPDSSTNIDDSKTTSGNKEIEESTIINDDKNDNIILFAEDPIDVLTITESTGDYSDDADKNNPSPEDNFNN